VRRVKTALIERVAAFGSLEPPEHFRSSLDEWRWLIAMEHGGIRRIRPPKPKAPDPLATMPSQEPQRSAEAVRRILPELLRLQRYESRAVSRRDRAIRAIALRSKNL
jgi:hypothetical protein